MNENEKYHNDTTRVSKSGLDLINKAPALYYERYLNPNKKPEQKTSKALLFGSGFHMFVLEPEKIENELAVMPEIKGVGSRKRREDFLLSNYDKTIVSTSDYLDIVGMRKSILKHPIANKLLLNGEAEKFFSWTDPVTDVKCKCKPDWLTDSGYIVDLKSTEDASNKGFERSAQKFRYNIQDSFYTDGVKENNIDVKAFIFIAVEKKPPYLVNCHMYPHDEKEHARSIYIENLMTYRECKENNSWPGYPTDKINELKTY